MLKSRSDPDFALVRRDDEKTPIIGISVNLQKKPYTCHSTMGGYCIKCPRADSCFDYNENNLWYNEFNINSDYVKFASEHNVEVILVSLFNSAIDTIAKWVLENNYEILLHDYVERGSEEVNTRDGWEEFYKKFTSRKRVKDLKWLKHSEVRSGKVPSFITGGWSNFGRPREVFCIDMNLAKSPEEFVEYIKQIDKSIS